MPRVRHLLLSLPLVGACGAERGVRPLEDEVSYSGWVYDSPKYEALVVDGPLTFTLPDADSVEAVQPYEDYAGYWQATLPRSTPFTLRVEAEGAYPTVWAGDTPGADGSWLQGNLFAGGIEVIDGVLASLDLPDTVTPRALADGAVDVWGVPLDGSDWDCAAVRVGGTAPFCFDQGDDGTLTRVADGPFDWFFAFDLPPGDVRVEDGFGGEETYPTQAGDLVLAFWWVHA
jgi:hypothetical protein